MWVLNAAADDDNNVISIKMGNLSETRPYLL